MTSKVSKFWLTFRDAESANGDPRSAYILAPVGNYYTWIDGEHTMLSCFNMIDDEVIFAGPDNHRHITEYWRGQESYNWQVIGFNTNVERLKWWLEFLEGKNPKLPDGFKLKPFPQGMKFDSQVAYIEHISKLVDIPADMIFQTRYEREKFIQSEYEKKFE